MKKIIAILLLSTILLSGCTNSTSAVNKSATSKTSATTSANNSSASKNNQKASNTVSTTANSDINSANAKKAPLSSADKTKVDNNVKPIITSIDSALNSLDEEKDITIN